MKKYIRIIVVFVLCLYSVVVGATEKECDANDGKIHVLGNDPSNGTNITIDGDVFRFMSESTIGNKKISTYVNDAGILCNIILIVDPKSNQGDVYVVVYLDSSNKRDSDLGKLNLHCKI